MKFQVIPIIYFTDSKGEPQIVLIDSWKSKFDELKLRNIPVLRVENLVSMFAFTPGRDNLQLAVDVTTFSTNYQFTVPRHMLGDYTKMTVKFMDENKIEDFFNDLAINR